MEQVNIAFRPARLRKPKRKKQQDPSLLRSLGEGALGVAGAVGNFLDTPGSMVRDTLAGQNPFDQLLSPMSGDNRISGRDLARQYGLAGKKDTWGNFAGGLAAEIGTDPLTIFGVGLLGKTATGARLAKTGATTAKGLGQGIRAGERALIAGKIPFGKRWSLGTGERAAKIGDKLDTAYEAARYSGPGRAVASMFSAKNRGRTTEVGQKTAQRASEMADESKLSAKKIQLDLAREAQSRDVGDAKMLRDVFEGVATPEQAAKVGIKIPKMVGEVLNTNRMVNLLYGRGGNRLDDRVKYFPRFVNQAARNGDVGRGGKVLAGKTAMDRKRLSIFKGWQSTGSIDEFFTDPGLKKIIDDAVEQGVTEKEALKNLEDYIRVNHFSKFDPQIAVKAKRDGKVVTLQKDRVPYIAKYVLGASDTTLQKGLYGNHPFVDLYKKMVHDGQKVANVHALNETLLNYLPEQTRMMKTANTAAASLDDADTWKGMKLPERKLVPRTKDTKTFAQVYKDLGLDPRVSAGVMLRQNGIEVTPETLADALFSRIPNAEADDLLGVFKKRGVPDAEKWIPKIYKNYLNSFKGFVLAHPARHTRDLIGGAIQNQLHGIASPIGYMRAHKVYNGGVIKGLTQDPEIQQWVAAQGLPLNDKTATDAVRFLYAENGPGDVFKHTDILGSSVQSPQSELSHVLGTVPGYEPSTFVNNVVQTGKTFLGMGKDSTWNPLKARVRGVADSPETTFAPLAASEKASSYTDTMNRLAPFIELKKQGYSSKEAMARINDVQVNYDPKTFTETEKWLKSVFPFYSYTSRMTKHVAKELATNPGGGLANAIRVQNAATDKSGSTPDHVSQTAAIPFSFGEPKDGTRRYLTGLGLMHEDALQFMQPSLKNFGLEAASRLNPLMQKGIEGITGQSLYFKGPEGTRPINELDPTIGRILANITGKKDAVRYPGDAAVEALVGVSPLVRLATTTRQLTDTRKGIGAKALNTLTGFRVTDVSPQAQERTLRRKLDAKAKELGARTFTKTYFPDEVSNDPQAMERIAQYEAMLQALNQMSENRKKSDKKKR